MVIPLSMPATTISNLLASYSSLLAKALKDLPSSVTLSPATGPSKGMPVNIKAVDEAIIAITSGLNSGSIDSTVDTTCTSLR